MGRASPISASWMELAGTMIFPVTSNPVVLILVERRAGMEEVPVDSTVKSPVTVRPNEERAVDTLSDGIVEVADTRTSRVPVAMRVATLKLSKAWTGPEKMVVLPDPTDKIPPGVVVPIPRLPPAPVIVEV